MDKTQYSAGDPPAQGKPPPRPRRAHGEGTYRVRAEGRLEWQGTIGGKRVSLYGKTRKELAAMVAAERAKLVRPKGTVAALARTWLTSGLRNAEQTTILTYEKVLELHILPAFGATKLAALDVASVAAWVDGLYKRGYSLAYVKNIGQIFRILLNYGVKSELLGRNPAALVTLKEPKPRRVPALSPEGAYLLAEAILTDQHYGRLFALMLMTGLRFGEALGLSWDDVDLERGTMHVRRQCVYVRYEGYVLKGLKSALGDRVIDLPPAGVALFERQRKVRTLDDPKYRAWKLVFMSYEGRPVARTNARAHFRAALRKAKLDTSLRPHDLRHHHAAILFASGVDPKVVQEILGHSRLGITMDIYTSLVPQVKRDASALVWGYLRPPGGVGETAGNSHPPEGARSPENS